MTDTLPEYYFRTRDNGAQVFRVENDTRSRRIEMDPIAVVNLRKQEIKPQGDRTLSPQDIAAVEAWMAERTEVMDRRRIDDIFRAIDHMNGVAQWAQSSAGDAELEEFTDPLLMAMHDLRTILVRKKAERVMKATGEDN